MQTRHWSVAHILISGIAVLTLAACERGNGGPVAQATPTPPALEVLSVTGGQETTVRITQTKSFDQCQSNSPLKAQIQFSRLGSQEAENGSRILFSGELEGGLPFTARAQLEAAIEDYAQTSQSVTTGHEESAFIEVPPHAHQEYTIVWREIRREGSISFSDAGTPRNIKYSIRTGLELESTKVTELSCSGSSVSSASASELQGEPNDITPEDAVEPVPATATSLPIRMPTRTPRPRPTDTPVPPDNTPSGTILEVGETWRQDGAELTLKSVQTDAYHVVFSFEFSNRKPFQISIEFTGDSFTVVDNRGRGYTMCRFFNGCWGILGSATLQPGDTWAFEPGGGGGIGVDANTTDLELEHLDITVKGISTIPEARWRVPIRH